MKIQTHPNTYNEIMMTMISYGADYQPVKDAILSDIVKLRDLMACNCSSHRDVQILHDNIFHHQVDVYISGCEHAVREHKRVSQNKQCTDKIEITTVDEVSVLSEKSQDCIIHSTNELVNAIVNYIKESINGSIIFDEESIKPAIAIYVDTSFILGVIDTEKLTQVKLTVSVRSE